MLQRESLAWQGASGALRKGLLGHRWSDHRDPGRGAPETRFLAPPRGVTPAWVLPVSCCGVPSAAPPSYPAEGRGAASRGGPPGAVWCVRCRLACPVRFGVCDALTLQCIITLSLCPFRGAVLLRPPRPPGGGAARGVAGRGGRSAGGQRRRAVRVRGPDSPAPLSSQQPGLLGAGNGEHSPWGSRSPCPLAGPAVGRVLFRSTGPVEEVILEYYPDSVSP